MLTFTRRRRQTRPGRSVSGRHRHAPGRVDVLTLLWKLWRDEWDSVVPTGEKCGPWAVVRHRGEEYFQITSEVRIPGPPTEPRAFLIVAPPEVVNSVA